ncbi:hypothetical protein PGIGA_G00040840, partial [Pangasianodon gigas]|nr:hypothetical protein [Pangasianodon gigas]
LEARHARSALLRYRLASKVDSSWNTWLRENTVRVFFFRHGGRLSELSAAAPAASGASSRFGSSVSLSSSRISSTLLLSSSSLASGSSASRGSGESLSVPDAGDESLTTGLSVTATTHTPGKHTGNVSTATHCAPGTRTCSVRLQTDASASIHEVLLLIDELNDLIITLKLSAVCSSREAQKIHKHRSSETQKLRNTEAQKHRHQNCSLHSQLHLFHI